MSNEKLINFELNGKPTKVKTDPEKFLLWVLRENLGLTGSKFGCGRGLCGSCSVLVEGKPVRSCITALKLVEGMKVETIEGLAKNENLHPVQQAWLEMDVPQCGYCQSGQIMNAKALLDEIPEPDESTIKQRMSGLICRCGTYTRILAAIKRASQIKKGERS